MKIVPTPDYLKEQYIEIAPTRLIEDGPHAGKHASLAVMLYTVGIMVGDEDGWLCRWCYESPHDAKKALEAWDGIGDPSGPWIKYKGVGGERHGPGSTALVRT